MVYACGFDRNGNENDSANQNDVAKMTLQNDVAGPNNVVC